MNNERLRISARNMVTGYWMKALCLVFIHLKLSGSIDWGWWWVMSPLVMVALSLVEFPWKGWQVSWPEAFAGAAPWLAIAVLFLFVRSCR